MQAPRIRGFIELTPTMPPSLLEELVAAAHRVSRGGQVVLVLTDAPIDDVVLGQARQAELVIADSERLSRLLLSHGILHMRAREGVQYLRSLANLQDALAKGAAHPFPQWW